MAWTATVCCAAAVSYGRKTLMMKITLWVSWYARKERKRKRERDENGKGNEKERER